LTHSFAIITDFNALEGDKIQLFGSINDYSFEFVAGGVDILYSRRDIIPTVDIIGRIENTTDFVPTVDVVFV